MDAFLARRAADPRYQLNVGAASVPRTAVTEWYASSLAVPRGTDSVVLGGGDVVRHNAAMTDGDGSKKLKRKKGSAEFTEAQKKKLRNRESSDDTDSGGCWSGYESVSGKKKGEKGSCRKKGGD
jgi:hypothetical protein